MELITILRELWHRRALVIVVAVIALTAGLLFAFQVSLAPPSLKSRQYTIGLASAQLLIDTPDSVVADLRPAGADALSARTGLLANVIASDTVRTAIARDAGVPVDRLAIITPSAGTTAAGTLLSTRATQAANGPTGYLLNIRADPTLPIIQISAQAPTVRKAAQLAGAATIGLRQYIDDVAATQRIPDRRRFVVTTLGAAKAEAATRGPRLLVALIVAIMTFVVGCAGIVIVSGIARGWRQAAELEQDDAGLSGTDAEFDPEAGFDDDDELTAVSGRGRERAASEPPIGSASTSPAHSSG